MYLNFDNIFRLLNYLIHCSLVHIIWLVNTGKIHVLQILYSKWLENEVPSKVPFAQIWTNRTSCLSIFLYFLLQIPRFLQKCGMLQHYEYYSIYGLVEAKVLINLISNTILPCIALFGTCINFFLHLISLSLPTPYTIKSFLCVCRPGNSFFFFPSFSMCT